jgi:TonB-linked SusC/RagA family outer membrane protein
MRSESVWKGVLSGVAVLTLALASVAPVAAQGTGTVRGKVIDAITQRPLAGAQVLIEGTTLGGLANANGDYLVLNVPAGSHVVRVEMLGFATQTQEVLVSSGGTAVADFQLRQEAIALDQIVVTGTAGGQQKRAIGNSVASVAVEGITEEASIANVQELLQARTPGLTILSNAGSAGASSRIRIRGAGSLNAGLEPIVYMDGVRIESGTQSGFSTGNGVVQGTSALDAINPDDIESMEVIKGPAAATLYGADAAGGVIQIITKKGRAGDRGIQWNTSLEYGQEDWATPMFTNYWYCTDSNISSSSYPGCDQFSPSTDPLDRILVDQPVRRHPEALRTADIWDFDLSARGGGESFSYYMSFEKYDQQGVFYNNYQRRTGAQGNFSFVPSEKLNFQVNTRYVREHTRVPWNNNSSNGILRNGFRGRAQAFNDPYAPGFRGYSPTESNQYNDQHETDRMVLGMTMNYQPWEWFTNKVTLGLDRSDRVNTQLWEIGGPFGAPEDTGVVDKFMPLVQRWTVDYSGTINTDISDNLNSAFSGGMQFNKRTYHSHSVYGEGMVANSLNLVGNTAYTEGDESFNEQVSLGFYVQEQLGWQNRLFGTVAVRVDDNSAFGEDFSLVVYPKASLAWVISEEDWFDQGWINTLRLRGAWGQAGNAPAPFSADRTFATSTTTYQDTNVNQLTFGAYGNPDLKAETGQEFELGFESSHWDDRLGIDFTWYYQQTKDALVSVPDPPSSGYSGSHLINVGEIKNSGTELLISALLAKSRNFEWDATFSVATNSNELVTWGDQLDEEGFQIEFGAFATVQKHAKGYPLGGFWKVGVEEDASGRPVLDSNGNAQVDTEKEFVGPQLPTREAVFANTFTLFGNWRVYFNLDYKGGHYQWCAMCSIRNRVDRNTWEVNNPNADPAEVARWRSLQTETHIMEADFIKFRELSLTYTLPTDMANRLFADRLSVTLSGRNLGMWTKYGADADPEVTFYSQSNFTQLDYGSMPSMRRLSLSVRAGF